MKRFQPVGKFILVNIVKAGHTVGGLVIPEISKGGQHYIVQAIGDEVTKVAVGEEIVSGGSVIALDNFDVEKGLGLVHQDQILGVLKNK
jgi:hypothetical protein